MAINSIRITPKRILWLLVAAFFLILLAPQVRSYFFELSKRWLYIFCFACSLSFILTPVMRAIAFKLGVVDEPSDRKIHAKATPLLGGVAIIIAFTTALIANSILETKIIVFLVGGLVVAVTSLWDDWKGLSARFKGL